MAAWPFSSSIRQSLFWFRVFRQKPQWWFTFVSIALIGWASWYWGVFFHYENLEEMMASYANPPQKLSDQWANDGGPMVFALFLGWAIALVYAALWLVVLGVVGGSYNLFSRIVAARNKGNA